MKTEINLKTITTEAIATMPSVDGDNNVAWDYAQRLLTKKISDQRKSGNEINDETAQELRAKLDHLFNTMIPHSNDSPPVSAQEKIQERKIEKALDMNVLSAIISDCFHTSTDGSEQHLAYLEQKATDYALSHIKEFELSWFERNKVKREVKRIVTGHLKQLQDG